MAKATTPKDHNRELIARVAETREAAGYTKKQMAQALDIEYETYRKYENRSPMPHYLIPRFALITHSRMEYLLADTGPRWEPEALRA